MISHDEWLGFAINRNIISKAENPACAISLSIPNANYENVDIYSEKFYPIKNINDWIKFGLLNKFIKKMGCPLHSTDSYNFVFTINRAIPIYNKEYIENNFDKVIITRMLNQNYNGYQSSGKENIKILLDTAQKISKSNTLIDIGCGLSEPLRYAQDNDLYKNLIGVEIEKYWIDIVKNEIDANFINMPAENYLIPDTNAHLFISNPFNNTILKKFIDANIEKIINNNVLILYYNPFDADHLLLEYGFDILFDGGINKIYGFNVDHYTPIMIE